MSVIFRDGFWGDVFVATDGKLGQVTSDGPKGKTVRCFLEDWLMWTQTVPSPLGFTRCAVHQDVVLSIHGGQDDHAYLVGSGLVRDLGGCFGAQPVAIDSHYAYVVRNNRLYDRIDLQSGEVASFNSPIPGSSQGISDVAEDGTLWWADLHRSVVISGHTFTFPNVRGPVTVGQIGPADDCGLAMNGEVRPVIQTNSYEPHVAVYGTRAAVCARTPNGAAYVALDLKLLGPVVWNEDQPKLVPEKEVSMPVAPNPIQTIRAVFAAHPEIDAAKDGERGGLVDHVVRALGGFPWGRKRKTRDGHELSDDALCYRLQDNRFEIHDIMIGRNPGDPKVPNEQLATFDYKGTFADGENGYFQTVSGTSPIPGKPQPPDQPPTAPSVDLAPLVARIAALEKLLEEEGQNIREVDERLSKQIDAVKPVDTVPLLAAFNAALSELVVIGKTRSAFGHQHDLGELRVVRKKP